MKWNETNFQPHNDKSLLKTLVSYENVKALQKYLNHEFPKYLIRLEYIFYKSNSQANSINWWKQTNKKSLL